MKTIPIFQKTGTHPAEYTHVAEASIDDEDYEELSKFKWMLLEYRRADGIISRSARRSEGGRQISMHREILNLSLDFRQVEHIDGNGLNNQRSNLRQRFTQFELRNMKNQAPGKEQRLHD